VPSVSRFSLVAAEMVESEDGEPPKPIQASRVVLEEAQSRLAGGRHSGFAELDEMPVRVTEEAPDLPLRLHRRRKELRAEGPKRLVCRPAVGDPDRHGVADSVRIRRG
jgi:hypothetical protein